MKPLRILITNWTMAGRHGSILYIRDLAWGLFQQGHQPMLYAPTLGEVSHELQDRTIPAADSLHKIAAAPDLIIGNSQPDLMAALLHFPGVPALFVCHAWNNWLTIPPKFPRLRRYIAVDELCRDWMVCQNGIPPEQVRMIHNAVDLTRFVPRTPLPTRLARAAVFSNYVNDTNGLLVIQEACRRAGVALDVIGGTDLAARPEVLLAKYDLVFGKGRCAVEALAVGCALLLCEYGHLGSMVTTQNWQELRRLNFGRRAITRELNVEALLSELARYDARDAQEVSRQIRAAADLDAAVAAIATLGDEVVEEQRRAGVTNPEDELRAVSDFVSNTNLYPQLLATNEIIAAQDREAGALRAELAAQCKETEGWRVQAVQWQRELQKLYEAPLVRWLRRLPGVRSLARRHAGL